MIEVERPTPFSNGAGSDSFPRDNRYHSYLLQLQDFLFLRLAHLFHLLDLVVGQLLNFIEGSLLVVLSDLLVFESLLDSVIAITTNVADSGAVLFQDPMQMLHHVLPPFLG